jgi:hypothetical protein
MRILAAFFLVLTPLLTLAETPLTADAFDRYTRGKTLYYSGDGARYGAEEYLDRRRVRWTFLDGQCKEGSWYASGQDICFVYEDSSEPQCWQFFLRPNGLAATFSGDQSDTTLYEITGADEDMLCLGPKIGV